MAIFYFHPKNVVAQKLQSALGERSFTYSNRSQLEFKLQRLLGEAGYDIWPQFHTILGALGGKLEESIQLNPDDKIDRQTFKILKTSKQPWSYVKVNNGPNLKQVIGYCSTHAQNPFSLGPVQMAQRGIINSSIVPVST